jgi:hypothetical protein
MAGMLNQDLYKLPSLYKVDTKRFLKQQNFKIALPIYVLPAEMQNLFKHTNLRRRVLVPRQKAIFITACDRNYAAVSFLRASKNAGSTPVAIQKQQNAEKSKPGTH